MVRRFQKGDGCGLAEENPLASPRTKSPYRGGPGPHAAYLGTLGSCHSPFQPKGSRRTYGMETVISLRCSNHLARKLAVTVGRIDFGSWLVENSLSDQFHHQCRDLAFVLLVLPSQAEPSLSRFIHIAKKPIQLTLLGLSLFLMRGSGHTPLGID